jgi:hypothetical protein
MSYAVATARSVPLAGKHNTQNLKVPSAQTQRVVIINTRDLFTIQSLRAMNSRNLKLYAFPNRRNILTSNGLTPVILDRADVNLIPCCIEEVTVLRSAWPIRGKDGLK